MRRWIPAADWHRVENTLSNNPKVVAAGPLGELAYRRALEYCAHVASDGFVPEGTAQRLLRDCPDPPSVGPLLTAVGLWRRHARRKQPGYLIPDFLEYNPSRAELRAMRQLKRAAGSKGGQATAIARKEGVAKGVAAAARLLAAKRQHGTVRKSSTEKSSTSSLPAEEMQTPRARAHASGDPGLCVNGNPEQPRGQGPTRIVEHLRAQLQRIERSMAARETEQPQ